MQSIIVIIVLSLLIWAVFEYRRKKEETKLFAMIHERFPSAVKIDHTSPSKVMVYTGKELYEVKVHKGKIVSETLLVG